MDTNRKLLSAQPPEWTRLSGQNKRKLRVRGPDQPGNQAWRRNENPDHRAARSAAGCGMMPANGLPQRRRRSVLLVATANQSRHNRRLWIMPGDEQPVAFDP